MGFALDHLFVCVSEGGTPEAERLADLGLIEGAPNVHPGQGTACRRYFFANAYLELVWVCDPAEARAEASRRLGLFERWSGRSGEACPFGVSLRPARPGTDELPFASWQYRPEYLPDPLCFHVATDSASPETPLLFYLPFGGRPDSKPEPRQPMQHPIGFREITRVLVCGPVAPKAETAAAFAQAGAITFEGRQPPLLEIGFDGERAGLRADLRPLLPLLFCW
jgi:hypothetical protein